MEENTPLFTAKYTRVRFHIEFGPPSLFERVLFKMKDVQKLYMDGAHFKKRTAEREIPPEVLEMLKDFDSSKWVLKTAEVRVDRGKFVDWTWETECNGEKYWVTIGIGDYITTIVQKKTSGLDKCIKEGVYFDFVEKVNRELMDSEISS